LDAFAVQQVPQHPGAGEWIIEMQFVDPTHDRQLGGRHRSRPVIDGAPAELEQLRLTLQRNVMVPIDHRFAPNRPALLSAPAKKSFSSVSWPILACRSFRSTGADIPSAGGPPNTPDAPSSSWARHADIWFA